MAIILIIDDVPAIRAMLRSWLEADGHTVLDAANSHDGITSVEAQSPDLVIVDVASSAVDGLSFLHAMRSRPVKARIIATGVEVVTASRDHLAVARVLGAAMTMRKPFVLKQFKKVIRDVLSPTGDDNELSY